MMTEYEARKIQAGIRWGSEARTNRIALAKEGVMVNHDEKQRLLRAYRGEPAWALGVLLKCAACLLILVGIAVIGARARLPVQPPMEAVAGDAPAPDQRSVLVDDTSTGSDAGLARAEERVPALQYPKAAN